MKEVMMKSTKKTQGGYNNGNGGAGVKSSNTKGVKTVGVIGDRRTISAEDYRKALKGKRL